MMDYNGWKGSQRTGGTRLGPESLHVHSDERAQLSSPSRAVISRDSIGVKPGPTNPGVSGTGNSPIGSQSGWC